jgi:pimeloyl-ACP methyl ester carboxylesterase
MHHEDKNKNYKLLLRGDRPDHRRGRPFDTEIFRKEPPAHLGDLPLLALSEREQPLAGVFPWLGWEETVEIHEVWAELQQELAALSTNSRRVVIPDSGHMIQLERPDRVVAEVSAFVTELRR